MARTDLLERIASLHPNALVAWDRDGMEIPDGAGMLDVESWPRAPKAFWAKGDVMNGGRRDGIGGVFRNRRDCDIGSMTLRIILYADPADPLGVKWWRDPRFG